MILPLHTIFHSHASFLLPPSPLSTPIIARRAPFRGTYRRATRFHLLFASLHLRHPEVFRRHRRFCPPPTPRTDAIEHHHDAEESLPDPPSVVLPDYELVTRDCRPPDAVPHAHVHREPPTSSAEADVCCCATPAAAILWRDMPMHRATLLVSRRAQNNIFIVIISGLLRAIHRRCRH